MSRRDVIVIGGGINGLVAAAYVARARRSVLVLEQTGQVGGLATTDELGGVPMPAVFPTVDRLHPSIVKSLKLGRAGFAPRVGGGTLLARPDGGSLYAPADGMPEELDDNDLGALRELEEFLGRVGRALEPVLGGRLPDPEPTGARNIAALLAHGWRLRRLGRERMLEAMRMLPMSLRDIVEERIADERLRAAVAWIGLKGGGAGPWAPGGGFNLAFQRPAWSPSLFPAPRLASGPSLADALSTIVEEAGGEIRTGVRVARIRVEDGRVAGVTTEKGRELDADVILSGVDPRTTLLELLEPGWLETDVLVAADNIRGEGAVSVIRFVVSEPLASRDPASGGRTVGRVQLGATLRELEQAADAGKYGRLPERPVLELTACDDAPDGLHGVHAWVQYTPRSLAAGDWSEQRDTLGERVMSAIEECLPGFRAGIEAMDVLTPADLESRFGIRGGHPYHVELALDQVLYMRPIPGCYDGGTPVRGLYMTCPGIHPGGGVSGLPGKLVAEGILKARRGS